MYTIMMNTDKTLITSVRGVLYQREKLVDKIQFLLPQTYNDISIADWTVTLKYLDQGNTAHTEVLEKDDELYKDHLRYVLPVDTNLNRFAGDITIRLTLTHSDMDTRTAYVLHSGELTISISPLQDWYKFVDDESLEVLDNKMLELEAKMDVLNKMAETYDTEKADDITFEDNQLQLSSNGEKIGSAIKLVTDESGEVGIIDNEFTVVEF